MEEKDLPPIVLRTLERVAVTLEDLKVSVENFNTALHEKGGICERLTAAEIEQKNTKSKISEHVEYHFKFATLVIGVSTVIAGLLAILVPYFFKAK
jgi:oligoribonuclease (3'-5' exoribonuclease)